jgi:hypothetical protein
VIRRAGDSDGLAAWYAQESSRRVLRLAEVDGVAVGMMDELMVRSGIYREHGDEEIARVF